LMWIRAVPLSAAPASGPPAHSCGTGGRFIRPSR
jgi:hypothetical protein